MAPTMRERKAAASAAELHADPDMGGGFTYPFYSRIRGPMGHLSSTMTLGSRIIAHMTPRLGKKAAPKPFGPGATVPRSIHPLSKRGMDVGVRGVRRATSRGKSQ